MVKFIILIIISMSYLNESQAQEGFDNLCDSMIFNLYSTPTDPEMKVFVQKYFASHFKQNTEQGQWSLHPPLKDGPIPMEHSFVFYKHPLFNFKFDQGKVVFKTQESLEAIFSVNDISVQISFSNKEEAEKAWSFLSEKFKSVSVNYKSEQKNDMKIILFSYEQNFTYGNSAELILYYEEPFQKHVILYRLGKDVYDLIQFNK